MINNISAILVWSEDYRALASWYQEKLGLQVLEELQHPNDTGVGFQIGNVYLWIGQHSQVKGRIRTSIDICLILLLILLQKSMRD